MDQQRVRQQLEAKQQELTGHIERLQGEALESREAEVGDPIDQVTSDIGKAEAFQESSMEYDTLSQVREALARLEDGTYGTCQDCGKPIEPARLEASPWVRYCREDQEKREKALQDEDDIA